MNGPFFKIVARSLFYPTLVWTMLVGRILKLREWWSYVDDNVILGALPLGRDPVRLQHEGVGAVLNLCDEFRNHESFYREHNIDYLRLPVVDFTSPDINTVRKGVAFIDDCIRKNKKVYVYCKAGRGRSATVVLCWLMKARNMSSAEALQVLLEKRPHINNKIHRRDVVREFKSI